MILVEQTERTKIPINIKVIQWLWRKGAQSLLLNDSLTLNDNENFQL